MASLTPTAFMCGGPLSSPWPIALTFCLTSPRKQIQQLAFNGDSRVFLRSVPLKHRMYVPAAIQREL